MIGVVFDGPLTGLAYHLKENLVRRIDVKEYDGTISVNALEDFVQGCSSIIVLSQGLLSSNVIKACRKFNVKSNFMYTRHESNFPKNEGNILRPEFFDIKGQNYDAVKQLGVTLADVDNILVPNQYTKDFLNDVFYESEWDTSTQFNPTYPFRERNITVAPMKGLSKCFILDTTEREDLIVCVNRGGPDRSVELFCQLEADYKKVIIGLNPIEQQRLSKSFSDITYIDYCHQDRVAGYLKRAKYAFYPFTCYVQGLSMYEAIACGTPVITYDKNFYDSVSPQPDEPITEENGVLCRNFKAGLEEAERKEWIASQVASTLNYSELYWEKNIEDIIRNRLL